VGEITNILIALVVEGSATAGEKVRSLQDIARSRIDVDIVTTPGRDWAVVEHVLLIEACMTSKWGAVVERTEVDLGAGFW